MKIKPQTHLQGKCLLVRQRHPSDIRLRLVLVNVVAQMQHIIDRVLFSHVPVGVEVALGFGRCKYCITLAETSSERVYWTVLKTLYVR